MARQVTLAACFLVLVVTHSRAGNSGGHIRYLRLTLKNTVTECTFTVQRSEHGWSVRSVTEGGKSTLTLVAKYDEQDRLIDAALTLLAANQEKTCKVDVSNGTARVHRAGKTKSFAIPPGVIVTSAPDWTDTFLLCRRYDRARGGKQDFAGLWIHPNKEPLRLRFSVEDKGMDLIEHKGKKQRLDRLEIHLRNNDGYAAWTDHEGRMIKLQPLQAGAGYALVLKGYESSAGKLRAPPAEGR